MRYEGRYERERYVNLLRRRYANEAQERYTPKYYYCLKNGHIKIDYQLWLKHQKEARVAQGQVKHVISANKVTLKVCMITLEFNMMIQGQKEKTVINEEENKDDDEKQSEMIDLEEFKKKILRIERWRKDT